MGAAGAAPPGPRDVAGARVRLTSTVPVRLGSRTRWRDPGASLLSHDPPRPRVSGNSRFLPDRRSRSGTAELMRERRANPRYRDGTQVFGRAGRSGGWGLQPVESGGLHGTRTRSQWLEGAKCFFIPGGPLLRAVPVRQARASAARPVAKLPCESQAAPGVRESRQSARAGREASRARLPVADERHLFLTVTTNHSPRGCRRSGLPAQPTPCPAGSQQVRPNVAGMRT